MKRAIEIVEQMKIELEGKCEEFGVGSNYSEVHDAIDVLDEVIKKLKEAK